VNVTAITVGGTSATATADQFTYVAAPTVTNLSPAAGPVAGGTSVTITGTGFAGTVTVKFGTTAATGVTVVSPTQITATSPAETAATVNVIVTAAGGTSATATADQFAFMAAPTVTAVSPASGPVAGGTTVTITGTNLAGTTLVDFGSVAATNVTVNTAGTQITATSPAQAAGTVNVVVTAPGGISTAVTADHFNYVAVPTVTGISPAGGPLAGGTSVTITGTGFVSGATVSFGGTAGVNATFVSATTMTANSPGPGTGTVDVTVTDTGGTSATSTADQFSYLNAATVTGISPAVGPLAGGTTVTITGTGFNGATAVNFGTGAGTKVTVVSATTIMATSPAETAGTVDVTVKGLGGLSAASSADKFNFLGVPTVTGVSPAAGPLAGGTTVTITGTNLTAASLVDFGTIAGSNIVVNSSGTQLTVTSPAETAGPVNVTVTAPGGVSAINGTDGFTYVVAPTVTAIGTSVGPVAGGTTVTITGTGFTGISGSTGVSAVYFGLLPATSFKINSATQITAVSPAGSAGTVDITVAGAGGASTTSTADQFIYAALPTLTGISPTAGPLAGATSVTITGSGFTGTGFTAVTGVKFGTLAASNFTVVSATQITATSPAESAGVVNVTVTGPGGTSTTSTADQYTYMAAPTVTGVSPTSGPAAGGATVTITGAGFSAATAVDFGTVAAASFSINSATQITAVSPAVAAGTVDVTVVSPGGTSTVSPADRFTSVAPPTVTGVSVTSGPTAGVTPAAGALAGGATVTVKGIGFVTGAIVEFGTTAATNVVVNGAGTQLTATSPAATAAGTVNITVTGPGGVSATSTADQFIYLAVPAVTGVSPASGSLASGTVTIAGSGFTDATAVAFGTLAATSFTVNSDSQITAVRPAEAAGTVDVTVTGPSGTSTTSTADQFSYLAAPTVTGISPAAGPTAGSSSVVITGTALSGATIVDFGTLAATSFTINSATQITAVDPAAATSTVNVTVTTPGGVSAVSTADQFSYAVAKVTGVSTSTAAGAYEEYSAIPIVVTFNQPVAVTGAPQLALNAGSGATAVYSGGSGTATLSFIYTIAAGQAASDLDYASTAALALDGGTIKDLAGGAATLTLPATGTDALAAKKIFVAPLSDGFESGNFSALPWVLSSSAGTAAANWSVESSVVESGKFAAQSGAIAANGSSSLSVTVTGAAGEISFWRKVSSASGSGVLTFEVDGTTVGQWSGAVPWQQSFYAVSAGTHTYTWIYSKGSGAAAGSDAAWLDNVAFTPGKTLTVAGTPGNDTFSFNAGSGSIVVVLNGESHSFTTSQFNSYVFQGGGGSDTIALTGASSGVNTAALYANGTGQLANTTAGFTVSLSGMASINVTGQAADTAQFYDAAGNETFTAYADYNSTGKTFAEMVGSGYSNSATGFGANVGNSTNGGSDTAIFYDSPSSDVFTAYADYNSTGKSLASLTGSYGSYSSGYSNSAKGFRTNVAYSTNGGSDTAYFYDSPGNDTFTAYADYNKTGKPFATMTGTYGGGFANSATGFATNVAYSTNGGSDTASFYDSPGNDTFVAYGDYNGAGKTFAELSGTYGGGYADSANGFATNVAYAVNGGSDTASFYDSPGNDTFSAYADYLASGKEYASMTGAYGGGFANSASGFSTMDGYSTNGGSDTANLYDSPGNDTLYTDLAIAQLYGNSGGYSEQASGFSIVNAFGTLGGTNKHSKGPDALSYLLRLNGTWS
jgi:hypothetical protein